MSLSLGQHDAIIVSSLVGDQIITNLNLNNIVKLDIPVNGFTQNFSFAVREDDKELLEKLNEGLSVAFASGVYEVLYDKWFPKPKSELAYTLQEILKYGLPLLATFVIIFLFIINLMLRSVVRNKTLSLQNELEKGVENQKQLELLNNKIKEKNLELENTLADFYTMRLGIQRDMELGRVEEENKKIKERLDKIKEEK